MLAVVQDQHQLLRLEVRAQRLRERPAGFLAHAQHLGGRAGDQRRIDDRREIDEPDAVRIRVHQVGADLHREARLAEAAHAEQRQQPRLTEPLLGLRHFALAADERRGLLRQVVRRRLERAQRRKLLPEVRMQDLVDVLGRGQVLQPDAAEIAQRDPRGQALAEGIDHGVGKQHLAAVRRTHDLRRRG